jgi:Trm5-related predicted tRNA methylase
MQTKLYQFLEKKINLPSNKEDMLESFNIDRVVQLDYYS